MSGAVDPRLWESTLTRVLDALDGMQRAGGYHSGQVHLSQIVIDAHERGVIPAHLWLDCAARVVERARFDMEAIARLPEVTR